MLVYKLLRQGEMEAFRRDRAAPLSPDDARDGFVHLSTAAQLAETVDRHFADAEALWLLTAEVGRLGAALRWEPSRGGELFPHLYGQLEAADVIETRELARGPGGRFQIPPEVT